MRLAILSSFPFADKQPHKVNFLENILNRTDIKDLIVIYSHSSIKDHWREFKKRSSNIRVVSSNRNVNLSSIATNLTLKAFAKKNRIKVYCFNRFSDENCLKLLQDFNCDIAHNFSGEFVPKPLLSIPKIGVLSGHYGKLPDIRGGDTVRWSIYLDYPMYVSHLYLAPVLDMGDIVLLSKVQIQEGDGIYDIRRKCQISSWQGHVKVLDLLKKDLIEPLVQTIEMGTTYYSMGKYLVKKVDEILINGKYSHYEKK